jgi:hypothetical protein
MRLDRKTTQEGNRPRFPLCHRGAAGARPLPSTYSSLFSLPSLSHSLPRFQFQSPAGSCSGSCSGNTVAFGVLRRQAAGAGLHPRPLTYVRCSCGASPLHLALGGEEGQRRSERGDRGFVKAGGEKESRENKVQRGCIRQPRVGVGAWQR